MGLFFDIVDAIIDPLVKKGKGKYGEMQVNSKLNPLFFGKCEHRQFNNYIIVDDNGKSHQIDHIEIRSNGIFCIETKNFSGWIYGNENSQYWTQTIYRKKSQFLNPIKQNKSHIYHLNQILNKKYKINSLIVLTQNNADKVDIPYVINLDDLSSYLKNFNDGTNYSLQEMDEIYRILETARETNMSTRQHVKNIKTTQAELKKNICPRCGGNLTEKDGKYGVFYGCSNFPKCKFTMKKEK
ncbi:MAG: hypothetical protein E7344_05115 [Clostridiales bacterium]|nr:hypothetical protein [Clostridiales bacterium]